MTRTTEALPPRPMRPGDIVTAYSEALGEWAAAQVTDLDPSWPSAGVLDLDWSGREPKSVEDLNELVPLRLTHHAHAASLSHCNFEWLLPRSYKVIGNVGLLYDRKSNTYSSGWNVGDQLARQRRWDRGERISQHPGERSFFGSEIADLVSRADPLADLWSVSISEIDSLDCADLLLLFPGVTRLSLTGNLGTLYGSASLNRLSKLKRLSIDNLFGMSASECPSRNALPNLEAIRLHSVPAEYAVATRKEWKAEISNGTYVYITGLRKPGWVADNRNNPLREWEGREHISAVRYRKSLAQYRATRLAVLEELAKSGDTDGTRFAELGREFGEAFNRLDGNRNPFIETEEREELFDALNAIVDEAGTQLGRPLEACRQHLIEGVESVRNW